MSSLVIFVVITKQLEKTPYFGTKETAKVCRRRYDATFVQRSLNVMLGYLGMKKLTSKNCIDVSFVIKLISLDHFQKHQENCSANRTVNQHLKSFVCDTCGKVFAKTQILRDQEKHKMLILLCYPPAFSHLFKILLRFLY